MFRIIDKTDDCNETFNVTHKYMSSAVQNACAFILQFACDMTVDGMEFDDIETIEMQIERVNDDHFIVRGYDIELHCERIVERTMADLYA